MPEVKYRLYRDGDEVGIVDVINKCFSSFNGWGLTANKWLEYEKLDYAFRKDMALVAEYDGRVVGHVQLILRKLKMGVRKYLLNGGIANVSTDPEFRRRGIATNLMRLAIKVCRERGIPLSGLFTGYPGTAHRVYRRVGYANTYFMFTFIAELDEIDEVKDVYPVVEGIKIEEIEPNDVNRLDELYRSLHEGCAGVALRTRSYWLNKILGDKVSFHTFFYDNPEAYIRVKAMLGNRIVGYALAFLPYKARYTYDPKDRGIILEILGENSGIVGSLALHLFKAFREHGLKTVSGSFPAADPYLNVFEGFNVFRCGGIYMEALPRLDVYLREMSEEFSSRLEDNGVKLDAKILFTSKHAEAGIRIRGHQVELYDGNKYDVVVRVDWDGLTRMIYGIEGFIDLYSSGYISVESKFDPRKVLTALATMFPLRVFHIWRIDHW